MTGIWHGVVMQCTRELIIYIGDLFQGNLEERAVVKMQWSSPNFFAMTGHSSHPFAVQEMDRRGLKGSYLQSQSSHWHKCNNNKERGKKEGGESRNLHGVSSLTLNLCSAANHLATLVLIKLQSWHTAAEQRKFCSANGQKCMSSLHRKKAKDNFVHC